MAADRHADTPDALSEFVGRDVADALHKWARTARGGTVSLPARPWRASGFTGAELVAIRLEVPGPEGSHVAKLIVKIIPADAPHLEAASHHHARNYNTDFAERHLVKQPFDRQETAEGRFLMFQEWAGGLLNYCTLGDLPEQYRAATCGQVARLLLYDWNAVRWIEGQPRTKPFTVGDYLKLESSAIDEAAQWAESRGLAESGDRYVIDRWGIGHQLPNPIRMAKEQSAATATIVEVVVGNTHGDLHSGNVLVPFEERRPGPTDPAGIKFIDLAAFHAEAPLTRDLVALSLSLVVSALPHRPIPEVDVALLNLLIHPRPPRNESVPQNLAEAVYAMHAATDVIPTGWQDDWQVQYLLSLQAGALTHTTYSNLGRRARHWLFGVAAAAAAEYQAVTGFLDSTRPVFPAPDGATQPPDQIVVTMLYADSDKADVVRRIKQIVTDIPGPRPWTLHDPRDTPQGGTRLLPVRPDAVLFLVTRRSIVDDSCEQQMNLAADRHLPVIPLQIDPDLRLSGRVSRWSPIDLTGDQASAVAELASRLTRIASPAEVTRQIDKNLEKTEAKEGLAEGERRRRLETYNREQRARREDERRRAAQASTPLSSPDDEPDASFATQPRLGHVRLVNEMPALVETEFRDRLQEMQDVEAAIADSAIRLVVLAGALGSGKTALIAELRQRLDARFGSAPQVDVFVYLSADGYREITVGTVLRDLVRGLPDDEEPDRILAGLEEPVPWLTKLNDVLTAFAQTTAVVVIDAAERLLDDKGAFHDRELAAMIDALTGDKGSTVTLILVVGGRPAPERLIRDPRRRTRHIRLGSGLPFDDTIDMVIGLDRTAVLPLPEPSLNQKRRIHSISSGHPRTLELLVGVLRSNPDLTLDALLDELETAPAGRIVDILLDRTFERLDRVEQRALDALAVFDRPVTPQAVDVLLAPFVANFDGQRILRRLYDRRVIRYDRGCYFLPPDPDARRVREGLQPGKFGDGKRAKPPYTLMALTHRAADYFAQTRKVQVSSVEDLRPQFSEIELRINGQDYETALELMAEIDEQHLRGWGHSDALTRWRSRLRTLLRDPQHRVHNISMLAIARQQQEDFVGIVDDLKGALRESRWPAHRRDRIILRTQIAKAYSDDGYLRRAAELFRRTGWQCRLSQGMQCEEIAAYNGRALCEARTGNFDRALRLLDGVVRRARRFTDPCRHEHLAFLLVDKGWMLAQIGHTDRAIRVIGEGHDLAQSIGEVTVAGLCLNGEAAVHLDSGDPARAVELAERAAGIGVESRSPNLTREAYLTLALAYLCTGERRMAARAAEASARTSNGFRAIGALGLLGITAFLAGDTDKAERSFRKACLSAEDRLNREPKDFQAWEAKGLALCGLALTFHDLDYRDKSVAAYRQARAVTRSAAGTLRRNRCLLAQFGDTADSEILAQVRRASEAEPVTVELS